MADNSSSERLLTLTAQIVASHVGHNNVPATDVPNLVSIVYQSLARLGHGGPAAETRPEPAVSVRKSITPDFIICLEDGEKLKLDTRATDEPALLSHES